jgi:hypothetical protein
MLSASKTLIVEMESVSEMSADSVNSKRFY